MSENKKYSVIYADPPWQYKVWIKKGEGRSAESHYITQTIEDLKKINLLPLCTKDCALLMWATFPCLKEAIALGEQWGFTYKTVAFTWVKKNKISDTPFVGMGHYTRANAEIVILFTKGNPLKRYNKDVQQVLYNNDEVIYSEVGKHSQKPDEIRKRIVRLFGDVPRLEMFARTRAGMFGDIEYTGWDVFGNQVNNSITLP